MMLALQRLTQSFEYGLSELKPLLLLVVVAAVYTNTELASHVLREIAPNHPNPLDYLTDELCQLSKKFEGVHNRFAIFLHLVLIHFKNQFIKFLIDTFRKVAVLGWCVLLRLSGDARPTVISYQPKRVIESCLTVFEGLQRALKAQAENKNSDWDSDGQLLYPQFFILILIPRNFRRKRTLNNLLLLLMMIMLQMFSFCSNKRWNVCEQHVKSEESKRLEQAGGYSFNAAAPVPSTFNFINVVSIVLIGPPTGRGWYGGGGRYI
uniref:Uncharacterized protein n=1 Tax=Heterorhabditis bacteriophora TaxID=37862 RepID=A0A1I7X3R1_HETBA